jgi:DNA primase
MRISQDTIEQVRQSNDIVDVVAMHVRLKKRGKNFVGLCPFHQEKTPSFSVSREKQMYYCFGCGKGGNVFTFVMEIEKVSFAEAVRSLAERAGVSLALETSPQGEQASEIEELYATVRMAGLFFHNSLSSEEGKVALAYFRQRGFSDETVRTFGLGYAPASWDAFLSYARRSGAKDEVLLKAGLVRKRDDGSLYDYFRGRVMFPILSPAGRVIGFGARKILEDDPIEGKYINSPETPIYNKSRVLYGLSFSKDAIRAEDRALMVEGYADMISVFQSGIRHVVASSGTALTRDQLELLGRYTKRITLIYDADLAGSNATLRGVDLALEQGFDVEIAELPKGEDPDSFIRSRGRQEFLNLLSRSVSFIDFKMARYRDEGLLSTPEGQTRTVRSIIESIARIPDELKRNFYIKDVAQKYDLYESLLFRELEQAVVKREPSAPQIAAHPTAPALMEKPPAITPLSIPAPQRDVLKLFLEEGPAIVRFLLDSVVLDDFTDHRMRRLMERVFDMLQEGTPLDAASFVSSLEREEELRKLVADIIMNRYELSKGWQEIEVEIDEPDPWEIARGAVMRMRKERVRRQVEQNQKRLKEAVQHGQDAMPFIIQHQQLLKQLQQLEMEIQQLNTNPNTPSTESL